MNRHRVILEFYVLPIHTIGTPASYTPSLFKDAAGTATGLCWQPKTDAGGHRLRRYGEPLARPVARQQPRNRHDGGAVVCRGRRPPDR